MATLYSEINRREDYTSPQYTKLNQRFRGPRESEKFNLEISQFYYSIRKLYEKEAENRAFFIRNVDIATDGGPVYIGVGGVFSDTFEDDFNGYDSIPFGDILGEENVLVEGTIMINGLEDMVQRLISLETRISIFENRA